MILEITEEEREFIERLCSRAELYAMKGIGKRPAELGVGFIRELKKKFYKSEIDIGT